MATGRTRILIVDDSVVMRSLLRTVVSADARLEVVASAADGESAMKAVETARPDLLLLDVEMPVMDGLATLRELRARGHRMPVIMCSSLTQRGAKVTIEALACGASDYVAKPAGQSSREAATKALAQDLIPKIHALTAPLQPQFLPAVAVPAPGRWTSPVSGPSLVPPPATSGGPARPPVLLPEMQTVNKQPLSSIPTVVAIGVSTGGPAALDRLLPAFPTSFPLPVMIVQHMPEMFTKLFAERLNGRCRIPVREAAEGDVVQPGVIYIARGNWHMEVLAASRPPSLPSLHLNQGPLENHCRPAVDVLFRSASEVYGSGVLAVVLTGMGSDGMIGCRIIRDRGGSVLAQDQATSTVWGMPGAVVNASLAQKVLPLDAIAPEILRIVSRTNSEARGLLRSAV
ncbi:MAG: chemotaxis response regulator protein-glutamate methylesterase [Terracidiphilus sp.]|jgi:two-component system chemotaxis response regulator CheB